MKIAELAIRDVTSIAPTSTLQEAATAMGAAAVGILPVVEGLRLVGTLSERDIAVKGCGGGLDPTTASVSEVFDSDPVACAQDADLESALELMRARRQVSLVVLDAAGEVAGVVSLPELLEVLRNLVPKGSAGPMPEYVRRVRGEDVEE